jgi:hypothetical protein
MRAAAILLMFSVLMAPAFAGEPRRPEVVICEYITDRAITLWKQGNHEAARAWREPLQQCSVLLRRALDEEARRLSERGFLRVDEE